MELMKASIYARPTLEKGPAHVPGDDIAFCLLQCRKMWLLGLHEVKDNATQCMPVCREQSVRNKTRTSKGNGTDGKYLCASVVQLRSVHLRYQALVAARL